MGSFKMTLSSKPYLIGITGTIGSGKSTVGKILESLNICVIDTDHIVHDILNNQNTVTTEIINTFGEEYKVDQDNNCFIINRKLLGKLVFSNNDARKKLEKIIHPQTLINFKQLIDKNKAKPIIACLVPLLFEHNLNSMFNEIWTISCEETILTKRIKLRDNLTANEINDRLYSQLPQNKKIELADFIIDNSKDIESTQKQIIERLKILSG